MQNISLQNKIPVSVLILTKNEERNILECIKSVIWADEVVVFDSFSNDNTINIAKESGVKVVQRQFDNFSSHKNWALENLRLKHKWILFIDADERVTGGLSGEISGLIHNSPKQNGYYIARKNIFLGKWIRHGGWYPDWQLRLIKQGFGHYESRIVHEHMILEGEAGFLKQPLIHYDYKGIERYFDRHNTYSSMEAVEIFRIQKSKNEKEKLLPSHLFGKGPVRRRFLKNLAYKYLPSRSLFKFLWMYFLKLGFLDGRMGFRFCLLHTFYEYQISLKLEELNDLNSPLYKKYQEYLE